MQHLPLLTSQAITLLELPDTRSRTLLLRISALPCAVALRSCNILLNEVVQRLGAPALQLHPPQGQAWAQQPHASPVR
jgi:hypothetical protein